VGFLIGRMFHKKTFCRISSKNNFSQRNLYRKIVFHADGMIAQTEDLKQAAILAGYPAERITVIPNMIPDSAFIERTGEGSSVLRILWCGRLHSVKNPMLLPEIAQRLKEAGIAFRIDVVGDGELRSALETAVQTRGLASCFVFHGFRKDTQIFYQKSDLYLLTSDSDALPNTVLEAMAAALPIVATDVDGVPLLVRDEKEALLFPPGDAASACENIKKIYRDPALGCRMGAQARQRAKGLFSEQSILEKYERMLKSRTPDLPGNPDD